MRALNNRQGFAVFILALVSVVLWAGIPWAAVDDRPSSYLEISPVEEGLVTDPPIPVEKGKGAWLESPNWRIYMSDFGYSDYFLARRPHWLRAWPYNYLWYWDEMISGEWAGAVYYDGIQTPLIAQGPNVNQPQCEWLEPNFLYPNWTTNSNFWVVTPITTWNRGHLPAIYNDTGYSRISNGQVEIGIDYEVLNARTAMGRCTNWFWTWRSFVWSDRYILRQTYHIKNVSGGSLTNLEFTQFLHGHPGTHQEWGWYGNWEVYDPNYKVPAPMDPFDNYQYDITQWGRQYMWTWPWIWPYWNWWGWSYIGFHSDLQPSTGRSPSAWGLGNYNGHGPGKPARLGVHWDVEEDNLNPQGPACTQYPGGGWPLFGRQVAGAETWHLQSYLADEDSLDHDILLSIANRPHHGWHWGRDWWYWYGHGWPYWHYPSYHWKWPHPYWGYPYYRLWLDFPYWWHCYYWPPYWPFWFGIAIPYDQLGKGVQVEGVYFKEYDPEGEGEILAEFELDPMVTADLDTSYHWDDCEWFGFSLDGYTLPDSQMVVYVSLAGESGSSTEQYCIHVMMGDEEFGWSPDHHDSLKVGDLYTGIPASERTQAEIVLRPNRPNPFNASTTIEYTLPKAGHVALAVYDVAGRKVVDLVDKRQEPGTHHVTWDARDTHGKMVGTGVYLVRLEAAGEATTRRMNLVK